jgi:arylsulfatase A-like enzyme
MPPRKRSTPAIGAAYGAVSGILFFAALAIVELVSLLPSQYPWLDHPPFGWLENAAVAYSLAFYAAIGLVAGAVVGAILFWIMSLRGRLIAVRWGWLPVSVVGLALLLLLGGKVLNVWIMPPRGHFSFYVWNGLYTLGCLAFALIVGLTIRTMAGLSHPRPRARVWRLLRVALVLIVLFAIYFGSSVALMAWTGAREEKRMRAVREPRPGAAGGLAADIEAQSQGAGAEGQPNVLLIVIETTRADHLSCYGYARRTTPNIDKWMAGQGALFENAIVEAPFSGPSKASIATGRYPQSHGVRDHPQLLPYREVTLAEALRANGYATSGIGAGAWEDPRYGYHQGFDSFHSITASYDLRRFWPFVTTFRLSLNKLAPWYTSPDERAIAVGADRAVEMANDWMKNKYDRGTPFFMHLEFNEPHATYGPPPPYDTMFGPTDKGAELMREMQRGTVGTGISRYDYESLHKDPDVLQQTVRLYDGEIAYVDHSLGRLFDWMASAGYLESTVVVVTADHGENFGEHGVYFCHTLLYETSLHVPLLIRYPREIPLGTKVGVPVELIDVYPTVLELAGIPTTGLPLDGSSLMGPIRTGIGKPYLFAESRFYHPSFARYKNYRLFVPGVEGKWRAVRHGNLKLIRIPTLSGVEWELYDLAVDPGEKVNLTGQNPMEDTLRDALERWMASGTAPSEPVTVHDEETRERLRSLGYID